MCLASVALVVVERLGVLGLEVSDFGLDGIPVDLAVVALDGGLDPAPGHGDLDALRGRAAGRDGHGGRDGQAGGDEGGRDLHGE